MSSTKFSFIVAVLFQLVANLAFAQETENELKLPEDLTIKEAKNYQLQELRYLMCGLLELNCHIRAIRSLKAFLVSGKIWRSPHRV